MNPWLGIKYLQETLKSSEISIQEIKERSKMKELPPLENKNEDIYSGNEYIYKDHLEGEKGSRLTRTMGGPILAIQSPYQKIEVINTSSLGKMLLLDNAHNISQKEEFIYHEMMIHPALLIHPKPLNILVIGAGDGGCLREIFKHKDIERVVMVEIDVEVINVCKMHFPQVACEFDNPKLELIIGEGSKYVSQCADQSFDIIIVDSTDNVEDIEGISTVINGEAFYKDCLRILTKNGIIVIQAESTECMLPEFSNCFRSYFRIFGTEKVYAYNMEIPAMGQSFAFCVKGDLHPCKSLDQERANAFVETKIFGYYSYEMHLASFTLPRRIINLLNSLK